MSSAHRPDGKPGEWSIHGNADWWTSAVIKPLVHGSLLFCGHLMRVMMLGRGGPAGGTVKSFFKMQDEKIARIQPQIGRFLAVRGAVTVAN